MLAYAKVYAIMFIFLLLPFIGEFLRVVCVSIQLYSL